MHSKLFKNKNQFMLFHMILSNFLFVIRTNFELLILMLFLVHNFIIFFYFYLFILFFVAFIISSVTLDKIPKYFFISMFGKRKFIFNFILFFFMVSYPQYDNHEIKPGKCLKINISVPNLRLFVGNIPKSKGKEEILDEFGKLTGK